MYKYVLCTIFCIIFSHWLYNTKNVGEERYTAGEFLDLRPKMFESKLVEGYSSETERERGQNKEWALNSIIYEKKNKKKKVYITGRPT